MASQNLSSTLPRKQPYYEDLPRHIATKFQDLDDSAVYRECREAIESPSVSNFIVDFGGAKGTDGGQAWCAVNIDPEDEAGVRALLEKGRPRSLRTRWINIFSPYEQHKLVKTITSYYGFSQRLINVITTPPAMAPGQDPTPVRPASRRRDRIFGHDRRPASSRSRRDIETAGHGLHLEPLGVAAGSELVQMEAMRHKSKRMNFMDLVQSVWHWHSVEWGGKYICVGFNHLHKVPSTSTNRQPEQVLELNQDQPFDTGNYEPEGKRLWSWLILCDDGTVISIHEPLPLDIPRNDLDVIRHNLFTVFRSLSLSHAAEASTTSDSKLGPGGGGLDDLPFRHLHTQHSSIHGDPSLLFYYLFDDWYSSYDFVVGRGAPYSIRMRNLRNEMHREPKLSHLSTLHSLTRQLSILKRLYESKRVILDNILYRQENSSTSTGAPPPHRKQSLANVFSPDDLYTQTMGDSGLLGVPLDPLAIAKFERLRDRIKLYVLGELSALLEEKVELENLTFNLISLKQSDTVAVLTRVTIWLTKFTFVFLPLTLVTGYFSMQLKGLEGRYNIATFWGTAGVTIALTAVVLYTVGKSTDTLDLWEMWRAVERVWFGGLVFWNRKRGERKKKKEPAKQWEVSS